MSYSEKDVPSQAGRTVFITGANTGIGYEAARVLAGRGARVLMGCRTRDKAEQAMQAIRGTVPQADLRFVALDLADLGSVRDAAVQVLAEERLDLLINNAGVMVPPKSQTRDGFELQFGVNHLGHFALTGLLLPELMAEPGARVVTVSSLAHRFGALRFDDLQAQRSYDAGARYGMSKLANLLFTFELHRRLQAAGADLAALACHPGGADTELARHVPQLFYSSIRPFARMVLNSAAEGALPTLRAATDPGAVSGEYYGPAGWFEIARSATKVGTAPQARNHNDAARLWEMSVELTGVEPQFA